MQAESKFKKGSEVCLHHDRTVYVGNDNFSCTSGMPFIDEHSSMYFGGAGRLSDGVFLYFLGHSARVSLHLILVEVEFFSH